MLPLLPRECHWSPAPVLNGMTSAEPDHSEQVQLAEHSANHNRIDRPWGLRDEAFEQRRPLRGQITKREVRAVSLYSLGLRTESILWDIGAGTGSISVEASVIAYRGRVFAIERDRTSISLLETNVARYSRGNVEVVVGAAPQALAGLPDPDSVFIGGSGGDLAGILSAVAGRLNTEGRIVANFATLERTNDTYQWLQRNGFCAEISMINSARSKAMPDDSVRLEALNPVFVVSAWREDRSPEALAHE